ncbi:MAG: hypothetical protein ABEJ75_03200 [Candidatus Nanohaloarchaea archaeon]
MSDKEVELGNGESEDYEVVPLGPVRKLEKRIDNIEQQAQSGGPDEEIIRDVLEIMKSNQRIVNDMTESTHELKNSVEDLTHKMDEVVDNMNDFMDLLTEASEVDMEGEVVGDMEGRIADAIGNRMDDVASDIQESNEEVIEHLQNINDSLRKAYASQDTGGMQVSGQSQQSRQSRQSRESEGRQGSGRSLNSESGADRVRKLKERFDSGNDE